MAISNPIVFCTAHITYFARFKNSMYFNVVAIEEIVYSKLTDRMFAPTFTIYPSSLKLISILATIYNQGPNKISMNGVRFSKRDARLAFPGL